MTGAPASPPGSTSRVTREGSSIDAALDRRGVLVCVGPGGVGKTTTSAALALRAASRGRKVMVLTVDPARRLASSLGLKGLLHEPTRVTLPEAGGTGAGELWAMMLDTKRTFDAVVAEHSPSAEARDRILEHPFYHQMSSALAGSQEYMAIEKLFELRARSDYDLIVLDTPPTRHALDVLDAPQRMEDFFGHPVLQNLVKKGGSVRKLGVGLFRLNALILKGVGRFVGTDVFLRILEFVEALAALSSGFAERAREVYRLLHTEDVGFVVVSAPDGPTLGEGLYFRDRLREERLALDAFVVNRVRPGLERHLGGRVPAPVERAALEAAMLSVPALEAATVHTREGAAHALAGWVERFDALAQADARALASLREALGDDCPAVPVPYFSRDVHDVASLLDFGAHLALWGQDAPPPAAAAEPLRA